MNFLIAVAVLYAVVMIVSIILVTLEIRDDMRKEKGE